MSELYAQLWKIRDTRVDDWFLLSSIWPTVLVSILYVLFSFYWGPIYMRKREAFQCKGLMMLYNVTQVLFCSWMFNSLWRHGWGSHYSYLCQPLERNSDDDSSAMKMAKVIYWFYISKFLDFFDTFFFVVRKKNSQISSLHVIHHGIMPLYTWIAARWLPGGQETFGALLNTLIHVLMYSYYFLSAIGPAMRPYLTWKKYLTRIQMTQFILIFLKGIFILSGMTSCDYPWQWTLVTTLLMLVFFALFYNFYVSTYVAAKK